MLKAVLKNRNPGPGTHEFIGLHTHTYNRILRGDIDPPYMDDKAVPVIDNLVPGPGTYDPNDHLPVPNFKISQPLPETKQHKEWQEMTEIKEPVGPQTYMPVGHPDWQKGVKIGASLRHEETGTFVAAPAPNRYQVLGDFDFRDPADLKNTLGKVPKFAFGIKGPIKPHGIDIPGPGTYETDSYPMN